MRKFIVGLALMGSLNASEGNPSNYFSKGSHCLINFFKNTLDVVTAGTEDILFDIESRQVRRGIALVELGAFSVLSAELSQRFSFFPAFMGSAILQYFSMMLLKRKTIFAWDHLTFCLTGCLSFSIVAVSKLYQKWRLNRRGISKHVVLLDRAPPQIVQIISQNPISHDVHPSSSFSVSPQPFLPIPKMRRYSSFSRPFSQSQQQQDSDVVLQDSENMAKDENSVPLPNQQSPSTNMIQFQIPQIRRTSQPTISTISQTPQQQQQNRPKFQQNEP